MSMVLSHSLISCPEPFTRAPRIPAHEEAARVRLLLAPPALQGAIAAIIQLDTRGVVTSHAQRLSHHPASPFLGISWFQGVEAGLVARDHHGPRWQPFGSATVVTGSQSQPTVSWAPTTGRAGIICFTADVAQPLFGIDPVAVHNRVVDARALRGLTCQPLLEALLDTSSDAAILATLEQHLAPRWQALHGRSSSAPSLRQRGRHWLARLAWQAHEWSRTQSARHVERRIKTWSGRSLREWRSLVKAEGAFFTARERHEAGLPVDLASIAQDEGFADQAHLSRAVKRLTGFSPREFFRRFTEDASFWPYRLWV
jgi:AraC-like DNA-binding protein